MTPAVPLRTLLGFIEEDAPFGDATTEAIIPDIRVRASIRAKDRGVIAGLAEARALFEHYGVTVRQNHADGKAVEAGQVLLALEGDARAILLVERTALNIIGRMSGIATQTHRFVEAARKIDPDLRIAATRKTAPRMRILDKKAVALGGGDPHRFGLSDGILIKDNHLALVPIRDAIAKARASCAYRKIEIEVENPEDAVLAAECGADIILLDNMPPERIEETLRALAARELRDRVLIEISGRITGASFGDYCRTGADIISIGALTHSVRNFDVSLEIHKGVVTFTM
ncbi:MAG: carboxylating nicotinate-nucleotide diphosphorylase [Methanomicrobiaceae archaeon]|uniref:Probable nicotinate-nucleotide pyrophosphorylase [carboxylating] n=1 Tax=hydrocarbon metagenome TaxID=938273 RepID=A0A0W8FJ56_9ZZZZ|nr:carboxylating nicotinate-nucleotide diphosphorylase [Methanomicrobiaceae archaeon]MDD5418588.1 carboxylating nicotinate-nucleotide diphosphorylase [Methanomicrobiaceae archaeon]